MQVIFVITHSEYTEKKLSTKTTTYLRNSKIKENHKAIKSMKRETWKTYWIEKKKRPAHNELIN